MNTYFVTGATGVLGSAIVRELIEKRINRLVLLIRAEDDDTLKTRAQWLFNFLQIDADTAAFFIDIVRGDIEQEAFGLGEDVLSSLANRVTHIIHCAAVVRMNLPLDKARLAAVTATRNVIHFAGLCKERGILKKVEIVSTVGVGGRWQGALPERWITESRDFHNTYEQSKAEAEAEIHLRIEQGMPITVHRPSMIVGHSKAGQVPHFQIFYHLVEFLSGRRTWGFIPDVTDKYVDLVPVDYVAKIIVWSSIQENTIGKILHLCAGPDHATSLLQLSRFARDQFEKNGSKLPRIRTLPAPLFKLLVKIITPFAPKSLQRALATLPIFLDYLAEKQSFSNTDTLTLIEPYGFSIILPKYFLEPVMTFYLAKK